MSRGEAVIFAFVVNLCQPVHYSSETRRIMQPLPKQAVITIDTNAYSCYHIGVIGIIANICGAAGAGD